MRKWMTTVAVAALFAGFATAAHAQEGWYGRADVGYSVDGHVKLGGTNFDFDDDVMGDIGLGYAFSNGFRVEGELAYRNNETSFFTEDATATSLMVNAIYDFNRGGRFQPYIGVGAGEAKVDIASTDDTDWAWQAMAGVGIPLNERATIDIGYRYFKVEEVELVGDPDAEYQHQAVTVGLRYAFGQPSPPPPPYVAPPSPPVPPPSPPPVACPQSDFVVYFEWDRSNLNADATRVIDQAVERARQCNVTAVTAIGHTDTSGSRAYNQGLSQRRADVVRDALVARGLSAASITTQARGETDLAQPTRDGVREPLNRRTAVTITFH